MLVSMLFAPHGNKRGEVEGWGVFFSDYGLSMQTDWGDLRTTRCGYGSIGRVMIDMLAVQTAFLAVLFAVVVNIRWRRKEKAKPAPAKLPGLPPVIQAKETPTRQEPSSNEVRQQPARSPQETTPQPSTIKGTRKKFAWRSVVGVLLLAGVSNSMRNLHPSPQDNPGYASGYLTVDLLFVAAGLGLIIYDWVKRPKRALLILGVCWLLAVAAVAYGVHKSAESKKQFGNAMQAFANDARNYVEAGRTGDFPTIKPTGNPDVDLMTRNMNGFFKM